MDKSRLQIQRYVCTACRSNILAATARTNSAPLIRRLHAVSRKPDVLARREGRAWAAGLSEQQIRHQSDASAELRGHKTTTSTGDVDLDKLSASIESVLQGHAIPSEQQSATVLRSLENAAQNLVDTHGLATPDKFHGDSSPTSAILSLDARTSSRKPARRTDTPAHVSDTVNALSLLAYRYVANPRVFITTDVLTSYVKTQVLLSRPDSFPEIFDLYANKPIPIPAKDSDKSPEFRQPNAQALNAAIPHSVASLALSSALHVRNLPLALSIIVTSYQAPAFKRAKSVRRALPPVAAASLLPVAFWTLASNMAFIQTGFPPETFTQMAFAGFATYAGTVGTIGYVAMTSANDQMKRVTWAPGMPLWSRWIREEERAAVDRVVCTWGFRETHRWGDEEGEDWAELKEWAGRNGMVVDKVSLMEGMQ